jgi:hypothetical protein
MFFKNLDLTFHTNMWATPPVEFADSVFSQPSIKKMQKMRVGGFWSDLWDDVVGTVTNAISDLENVAHIVYDGNFKYF